MKEKNLKLYHKYTHYKNLMTYIPINYCKIQKDDIWVDAVIYEADDKSLYVRSIQEFIEKFNLKK